VFPLIVENFQSNSLSLITLKKSFVDYIKNVTFEKQIPIQKIKRKKARYYTPVQYLANIKEKTRLHQKKSENDNLLHKNKLKNIFFLLKTEKKVIYTIYTIKIYRIIKKY